MKSRSSKQTQRRQERGLAMVEFIVVLPVILFLMFGVVEVGRVIMRYNTLTKALQDGARHAAAYGLLGTAGSVYIDGALEAEIVNLVVYGDVQGEGTPLLEGFSTGQVAVSMAAPGWIQVSASYPYVPALGSSLPNFGFGTSPNMAFNLAASVTTRAL
jgi:Flp pilus assembly protein TadG